MSFGQQCKHCMYGKMRPIHFSLYQALVLCDNSKCKSLLDVTPSESIIRRDFQHPAYNSSSKFDIHELLLDGRSSCSTSGVYSDTRSSLPSPAQSRKSITDEEVELLLKESYAPQNSKNHVIDDSEYFRPASKTQVSVSNLENTLSDNSSSYDGFFELLGNLDLEPPSQSVNIESQSESACVETGLDVVTTELEYWMKNFDNSLTSYEGTSSCSSSDSQKQSGYQSHTTSTNTQDHVIPSHRSAFFPLDPSKEDSTANREENALISSLNSHKSFGQRNSVSSEDLLKNFEDSFHCVPYNESGKENVFPAFHTQYMSPCASAASEDSGYNEDVKASNFSSLAMCEENCKVSSKLVVHSSLKNLDNNSNNKSVIQASQDIKNLLVGGPEQRASHDMLTFTVLPALVTTEKDIPIIPEDHYQTTRSSTVTHPSSNSEITLELEKESEGIVPSSVMHVESTENSLRTCIDEECSNESLQSENSSTNVSHDNVSEFPHSVVSQPQHLENFVCEGFRHESSVPENISGDVETSVSQSNLATDTASLGSGGGNSNKKGRRGRRDRSRRIKKSHEPTEQTENPVLSDCKQKVPKFVPRGRGRGKDKSRGRVRSRSRSHGFMLKKKGQLPVGKSAESQNKKKKTRSVRKGLPRQARQNAASFEVQASTSSSRESFQLDASEELHKRGLSITQNTTSLSQARGTRHHGRRLTNPNLGNILTGAANKDPWSIPELFLEELAIEVLVQGVAAPQDTQRKASSLSDKAADCNSIQKCDFHIKAGTSKLGNENDGVETPLLPTSDSLQLFNAEVPDGESFSERDNAKSFVGEEKSTKSKQTKSENFYSLNESLSVRSETVSDSSSDSNAIKDCFDANGQNICIEALVKDYIHDQSGIDSSDATEKNSTCNSFFKDHDQEESVNIKGMTPATLVSGCSKQLELRKKQYDDRAMSEKCKELEHANTIQRVPSANIHPQFNIIDGSENFQNMTKEATQPFPERNYECVKLSSESVMELRSEINSFDMKITNSEALTNKKAEAMKQQRCEESKTLFEGGIDTINLGKKDIAENFQYKSFEGQMKSKNQELSSEAILKINNSGYSVYQIHNTKQKELTDTVKSMRLIQSGNSSEMLNEDRYKCQGFDSILCYTNHQHTENEETVSLETPKDNFQATEIDSTSTSSNSALEANLQCHFYPLNVETVRSWLGHQEKTSVQGNLSSIEEKLLENHDVPNPSLDLKTSLGSSSSKYFEFLTEDMDFDENFFQSPVDEPPSKTFVEHLNSSLFFGETASNSPDHVEESKDITPDFNSDSFSETETNKNNSFSQICDEHEAGIVTSAASSQIPLVPLRSNIAQVPITSCPSELFSWKFPSSIGEKSPQIGMPLAVSSNPHISRQKGTRSPDPMVTTQYLSHSGHNGQLILDSTNDSLAWENSVDKHKYSVKENSSGAKKHIEEKQNINELFDVKLKSPSVNFETKQGSHTELEHARFDCQNEKNNENSATSYFPILDFNVKELRSDASLDVDMESIMSAVSNEKILPGNGMNLVQAPVCYSSGGVHNHCKSVNVPEQTPMIMSSNMESNYYESSSNTNVDDNKLPLISHDSDDGIRISIPEKGSENVVSQKETEKCNTPSDENCMTERDLVDSEYMYNITDEKIEKDLNHSEVRKAMAAYTQIVHVSSGKRKADDGNETETNKRAKLLQETENKVKRKRRIDKQESKVADFSDSQSGSFMCGILDNSIVHDEHCLSSSQEHFKDLTMHPKIKKTHKYVLETYSVAKKHHSKRCDNKRVKDIPTLCVKNESLDKDHILCNNVLGNLSETVTYTNVFNQSYKFGDTKSSPEYNHDSYPCVLNEENSRNPGLLELDSPHAGFLTSEENCVLSEPPQEQRDADHSNVPKYLPNKLNSKFSCTNKRYIHDNLKLKEGCSISYETEKDTSEWSQTSDSDNLKDGTKSTESHKKSCIPSTNHMPNLNKFHTSVVNINHVKSKLDSAVLYKHQNYNNYDSFNTTIGVPETVGTHKKTISEGNLHSCPSVSSLLSDGPSKASCLTNSVSLPPLCSHKSSKTDVEEHNFGNQGTADSVVHPTSLSLPVFHNLKCQAAQPLATSPSIFLPNNNRVVKTLIFNRKKETPVIDYQIPVSARPPTIVPPALATSYANTLHRSPHGQTIPTLSMRGHTTVTNTNKPLERLIVVTNKSANGPVTTILKVVTSTASPNNLNDDTNPVKQKNEKDTSDRSLENESETHDEPSMLKKVKLGSKGSFYMRPSSALKNAISKMRKNENSENKEDMKESSSGYVTLPDGTPISHPIYIPSKKMEKCVTHVVKKRRKRTRKKNEKEIRIQVEEEIKRTLECSAENKIPKVIVIYVGGNFHICQVDLD